MLLDYSIKAVKKIYETYNDTIQVCLSGGIDSHAVLHAVSLSNIPAETTTFYYIRNCILFNEHEVKRAEKIANNYGIKQNKIKIDPISFYENGDFIKWYNKVDCSSPQLSLHMECMNKMEGIPIISGQPPVLYDNQGVKEYIEKFKRWGYSVKVIGEDKYYFSLAPDSQDPSYYRFFKCRGNGVHNFFFYSNDQIKAAVESYDNSKWSYYKKWSVYSKNHFPVKIDDKKRTGFEEIKLYFLDKFDETYRKPWVRNGNHEGRLLAKNKVNDNYDILKKLSTEKHFTIT